MKIIKKLFRLFFLILIAAILIGIGYYLAVTRKVTLIPEKLIFNEQTLTVYDGNDTPVRNVFSHRFKQNTAIDDIPRHVQQAFVAVEDKRFYTHRGYDPRRILRASLNNVKAGGFKEGASTISQQLIKNTHLSQEKTIKRKLQEWKLTRELEKRYTKDEILECYLNTIYFGHGCFGITSAADFYFGKTPNELNLAEGAALAGLVKAPNHYSPFKNPQAYQRRRATVLTAMERNGNIRADERQTAIDAPLPQNEVVRKCVGYPDFLFDELAILAEQHSFKIGGKIEIYTYFDPQAQHSVESIAAQYTQSDKTMLVLDTKTRGFKACVSTFGNRPRLPGSLLKPLLVYAPAIEEDILSPATPILDEKIRYGNYSPENYDGSYHGYVSARECVEKSLNIPAVKTLESLTVEKGAAYLKKLDLPVLQEDKSLALALGGMKEGYTLKDLTAAYATFANGGTYTDAAFISAVTINGVPVYTRKNSETKVFSEETTYLMTDMLKSTAHRGTAKKLRTLPFEIAAKTGTVGTKKGNTDAYALSYTTSDVAAVWLGNADNKEILCTGGGTPCNLLYQINQSLYENYTSNGKSITPFPTCQNISHVALDKTSYYDTHTLVLADDFSPPDGKFCELFKKSSIPLNKSTSYSQPTIHTPQIQVKDNRVEIHLDKRSPRYYSYRIERYDYVTHTTIYKGNYQEIIYDKDLEYEKNYLYTVIPIYENIEGTPLPLPVVTTKTKTKNDNQETPIPEEWWKY